MCKHQSLDVNNNYFSTQNNGISPIISYWPQSHLTIDEHSRTKFRCLRTCMETHMSSAMKFAGEINRCFDSLMMEGLKARRRIEWTMQKSFPLLCCVHSTHRQTMIFHESRGQHVTNARFIMAFESGNKGPLAQFGSKPIFHFFLFRHRTCVESESCLILISCSIW